MAEVTLAAALQIKNRLIERINHVKARVLLENSVKCLIGEDGTPEPPDREFDYSFDDYSALVDKLIDLKVALDKACLPIRRDIYMLGELKTQLEALRVMNTTRGRQQDDNIYSNDKSVVYFDVKMSARDVEELSAELRADIDKIQSKLNSFNHQTKVTIPDNLF